MSAPREAYTIQPVCRAGTGRLVKIQPEERLATSSELNPAPGGVTCHREARGMGCWAATSACACSHADRQVKGLSPEITIVSVADGVHESGRQYSHSHYWRGCASPTGSETVARYQKDNMGTRETHNVPVRVWDTKPIDGKASQMAFWESDQLIVVMKQGNTRGAKGLAGRPWNGDTSSRFRTGYRKLTKPISVTHLSDGEEVFLKSRMRENCKYGSVRGFIVDSERRWL